MSETASHDLTRAQAAYLQRKAEDRAGFLKTRPEIGKDGFDLATGALAPQLLEVQFGRWEETPGLEEDPELAVLQSLHAMARERFAAMVGTFIEVRDDDDPSLNADGRLKIAARILEPKLAELDRLAEREFERVGAEIRREEAEIGKAIRVADPIDIAVHGSIREHFKALGGAAAVGAIYGAMIAGDVGTLQAIATAPPYLSGLIGDSGKATHAKVQARLAELTAPERVKRVTALKLGLATASQAVQTLGRKADRLIDFKKARALNEREAQRRER